MNNLARAGEEVPLLMCYGFLGVEFFFILSGYLMAQSAAKERLLNVGVATARFIKRKYLTIFPYFIVAWMAGFVVLHSSSAISREIVFADFIKGVPDIMWLYISGIRCYQPIGPTWYLSAMILSMLIQYPLLLRYKESFLRIIAPLISIFCYGYIFCKVGNLAVIGPLEDGFVFCGLIRGLAGIALGCFCYDIAWQLSNMNFSVFGRFLVSLMEIGSCVVAFLLLRTQYTFRPDFIVLLLFSMTVIFSFSGKSLFADIFQCGNNLIGLYAMCFYFADSIGRQITLMVFPDGDFAQRQRMCIVVTLVVALLIMLAGTILKETAKLFRPTVKRLLFSKD